MLTLVAKSLTLAEISERPRASASCTIGTMRPPGVCTATLTSMLWYCLMKSVFQEAFTSGTFRNACSTVQTNQEASFAGLQEAPSALWITNMFSCMLALSSPCMS